MDAVIRAAVTYFLLLVIFRVAGKRTLSQATTFDLVLLLIISEAAQQALTDDDRSFTNSALLIVTLVALNIALSLIKQASPTMEKLLDGAPLIILEDGKPKDDLMKRSRVDVEDILTAARETQGLARLDQIKYAVLERSGGISIIPKK
jgi:uncharacterized membrane protein YcaP (DUF421 family)